MPNHPNPIDNPDLYYSIKLGEVRSPGKVKLSGHNRTIKWDVKSGNGQAGASITKQGVELTKFKATFSIMRDLSQGIDDYSAWPAFAELIWSTVRGQVPKALDIYHPELAANDIKSVVLADMGPMVDTDRTGESSITVEFLEYAPPVKTGGTAKGSAAKAPKPNDPNAAANAELAALRQQYMNTPWG